MTPIPLTDTSRPPQFPCWVWDRELQFWRHSDAEFFELCNDPSDTHWHPDQPDAPTERPQEVDSTFADQLRAECSKMTPEQREQAYEYGMKMINQSSDNRQSDTPRTDGVMSEIATYPSPETIIDLARTLERELVEARAYADKLAAGLPDGLLPADVDNLRKANGELAQELAEMTEDRDKLMAELAATKAALEAQADYQRSLRADRDRLDWLQADSSAVFDVLSTFQTCEDIDLRAAIDAAMGVAKPQQE